MCKEKTKCIGKCKCGTEGNSECFCKVKPLKRSRADRRQAERVNNINDELKSVEECIDGIANVLYTSDPDKITPIDVALLTIQYSALQTYYSAVSARSQWESVRTRNSSGEYLHRSGCDFLKFIFGKDAYLAAKEYNLLPKCSKENKMKKCKCEKTEKTEKKCKCEKAAKVEKTDK